MVGQGVAKVLTKQLILAYRKTGYLPNCILITGPWGTGKTTLARIIGMYVNCEEKKACGKCTSCTEALAGVNPSILEVDAASNGGKNEIKKLAELVNTPTFYNRRIIILDEAHEISKEGANAALKMFEEVENATFILCTTEKDALIKTILSRSFEINLNFIPAQDIVGHLAEMCSTENIQASEEVLNGIASMSDGHMRDAIQLLDTLRTYKPDKELTLKDVFACSGITDSVGATKIITCFLKHTKSELAELLETLKETNARQLVSNMKNILEVRIAERSANLADRKGPMGKAKFEELLTLLDFLTTMQKDFSRANHSVYVVYHYLVKWVVANPVVSDS